MPVNQEYKLLFVHIPKAGGTSVEECLGMRFSWKEENLVSLFGLIQSPALLRHRFSTNFLQHLTLQELSVLLGDELDGLIPFALLRDPWTRFLSSFRRKDPDLCSLYRYKCHKNLHDLSLEEYVDLAGWLDHPHLRPQWKFLCSSSSGGSPDPRIRLFRQDDMSNLESWLSQYLGRSICLPRVNVNLPLGPLPDLSSGELQVLKTRVNTLYAQDVDLLDSF